MKRYYFDTAASTPLDPQVRVCMERLRESWANGGSIHTEGEYARATLEEARRRVAHYLGVKSYEVVFTASGTESNNLACFGVAYARPRLSGHLITVATEHSSVLEPLRELARRGMRLTELIPDSYGRVSVSQVLEALTPETVLVSLGLANAEVGTLQPVREIAQALRAWREARASVYPYLHSDACQAPRVLSVKPETLGVDLLTISGVKVYGPHAALLFVRSGTNMSPLLFGGGQEHGLRSGTPDPIAAAGFSEALSLCAAEYVTEAHTLAALRDEFVTQVCAFPGVSYNGHARERLPHNAHFSFRGITGERMVIELDRRGVSAATGSACSERTRDSSHVLRALGAEPWQVDGAVRFTLGRGTTREECSFVAQCISDILHTCTRSQR